VLTGIDVLAVRSWSGIGPFQIGEVDRCLVCRDSDAWPSRKVVAAPKRVAVISPNMLRRWYQTRSERDRTTGGKDPP